MNIIIEGMVGEGKTAITQLIKDVLEEVLDIKVDADYTTEIAGLTPERQMCALAAIRDKGKLKVTIQNRQTGLW